jgi:hypothetical protein
VGSSIGALIPLRQLGKEQKEENIVHVCGLPKRFNEIKEAKNLNEFDLDFLAFGSFNQQLDKLPIYNPLIELKNFLATKDRTPKEEELYLILFGFFYEDDRLINSLRSEYLKFSQLLALILNSLSEHLILKENSCIL